MTNDLIEARLKRRNRARARWKQYNQQAFEEEGKNGGVLFYGLQIPPPLNPLVTTWIELVSDGYQGLTEGIEEFREKIAALVKAGKLDPAEKAGLQEHCQEFQDAIDAAAAVTGSWKPTGVNPNEITSQVNLIADYAKHVYAVGSRDVSALQYRLRKLAYAGKIDIEAHNDLQHDVCYGLGEGVYAATTQKLHDHKNWDGSWDWDDNTYSDGRQIMIKARITDWEALCGSRPRNDAITMYGDGVINEHPEGMVCQIAPVEDPHSDWGYWHPPIEINLGDLLRHAPW